MQHDEFEAPASVGDERAAVMIARFNGFRSAGLHELSARRGRVQHELVIPPSLRHRDGRAADGLLAILADSALGDAIISAVEPPASMVTSHLHLDLWSRIPVNARSITCVATLDHHDQRVASSHGTLRADSGEAIGSATFGGVITASLGEPVSGVMPAVCAGPSSHRSVEEELRLRVEHNERGAVRAVVEASPTFANTRQAIHGGWVGLIGEQLLNQLVRADGLEPGWQLTALRVAFIRATAANGEDVLGEAEIVHHGRTMRVGRAVLRNDAGKPAAWFDATYMAC